MLKPVDLAAYESTLRSKRRGGIDLHRHYPAMMHQLVARWAKKLAPHQTLILLFVLDRTMYHGKLSETIAFDQFLGGMARSDRDEMVFNGLNMSKNTLVLHLKELVNSDLLHACACIGADGRTEIRPRLFAINCKKLFNLDIADEENPMILREPKAKKQATVEENDQDDLPEGARKLLKTPRKAAVEAPKNTPPNLGGIYTDHRITKVIHFGDAAPAEQPKKVSVVEAMENLRATREALKAQRPASRTTRRTATAKLPQSNSMAHIQTLFDTAMQTYHRTLPRVLVAAKPFGVFRKRLAEMQIEAEPFIDWAVKAWMTTAQAHARGARRNLDGDRRHSYTAIPAAPDFSTLAYRLPYFAAAYRSYLQAERIGAATDREGMLERKVEKLERKVRAAQDDARSAQERERAARRRSRSIPPDTTAPTRPARIARPVPTASLLDDDLPPSWDELDQKKAKA